MHKPARLLHPMDWGGQNEHRVETWAMSGHYNLWTRNFEGGTVQL